MFAEAAVLGAVCRIVLFLIYLAVLFIAVYVFPLAAVSELRWRDLLRDALGVSVLSIPSTLLSTASILLVLYLLRIFFPNSLPAVLLTPGLLAFISVGGSRGALKKYVLTEGQKSDERCGQQ